MSLGTVMTEPWVGLPSGVTLRCDECSDWLCVSVWVEPQLGVGPRVEPVLLPGECGLWLAFVVKVQEAVDTTQLVLAVLWVTVVVLVVYTPTVLLLEDSALELRLSLLRSCPRLDESWLELFPLLLECEDVVVLVEVEVDEADDWYVGGSEENRFDVVKLELVLEAAEASRDVAENGIVPYVGPVTGCGNGKKKGEAWCMAASKGDKPSNRLRLGGLGNESFLSSSFGLGEYLELESLECLRSLRESDCVSLPSFRAGLWSGVRDWPPGDLPGDLECEVLDLVEGDAEGLEVVTVLVGVLNGGVNRLPRKPPFSPEIYTVHIRYFTLGTNHGLLWMLSLTML